jgi:division protein CdvB (Snf7/Vps24/ESCRT-III family)
MKKNNIKEHHKIALSLQKLSINYGHMKTQLDKVEGRLEELHIKLDNQRWKLAGVAGTISILVTVLVSVVVKAIGG